MNYTWCRPFIPEVACALEVGSRDLEDAHYLASEYKCLVYAFECSPVCLTECVVRDPNVHLVPAAVSRVDGEIDFWEVDPSLYNNKGASSMYEVDFSGRPISDPDRGRPPIQRLIRVQSTRLDTFCRKAGVQPDALFMDVQEAEFDVLESAGDVLDNVKYIVLEGSVVPTYKGGCSITDVDSYLTSRGFVHAVNTSSTPYTLPTPRGGFDFYDFLYVRK